MVIDFPPLIFHEDYTKTLSSALKAVSAFFQVLSLVCRFFGNDFGGKIISLKRNRKIVMLILLTVKEFPFNAYSSKPNPATCITK